MAIPEPPPTETSAPPPDSPQSLRLGEILIERGKIEPEDLERALELQQERGDKIGKILVDMGFIAQRDVLAALSEQLRVPLATMDAPPPAAPEIDGLSPRFLRQFRCFPVRSTIQPDARDGRSARFRDALGRAHVHRIRWSPCSRPSRKSSTPSTSTTARPTEKPALDGDSTKQASEDLEHLRDMASEAPVIRLVNAMIAQAVEKRASDIHIEPFEKEFRIRYRIDGVLTTRRPPPRELKAAIISRVKLMAKLNIAERRLPQDGRIKIKTLGPRSGSPRLHAADALRRKRRHAPARPLGGRFLRSAQAGLRRAHARAHGVLTPRCRTAFFWSPDPPAAANRPRSIRRSSASTFRTRRSSPSKIRSNTRWTGSTRST